MRRLRLGMMSGGLTPAAAFLAAAGITDPTITAAINTLVNDLVGYGIWNKILAIYPFVGGTATTHKFNLKDPRDLNAAFRLVFSGGITHNASGVTGNGVNGSYNTNFSTAPMTLAVGGGVFVFIGNNTNIGGDLSNFAGAPNNAIQLTTRAGGDTYARGLSTTPAGPLPTATSIGFFGVNREANDNVGFYVNQNGVETLTAATYASTSATIYGLQNGPFGGGFGDKNHQTSVFTAGLTLTERTNLRTALNTFNVTNLGR